MCNPALAVTAMTTAISAAQQTSAARDQNRFNAARARAQRDAANRAAQSRYKGLAARQKEQREQAAAEVRNLSEQALKAAGVARLEGAGASVGAALSNLASQRATGVAGIRRSQGFADAQTELEFEATRSQLQGRLAASQFQRRSTSAPFINAAISIAGSAVSSGAIDFGGGSDVVAPDTGGQTVGDYPLI